MPEKSRSGQAAGNDDDEDVVNAMSPNLPLVKILATGGTIAGKGENPLNTANYQAGLVPLEELTAAVPGLTEIARVEGEQILNVPSSAMSMEDLVSLANRVNEIMQSEPEVAGIVITHGTDTLEETAYFCHLVVQHSRPVVLVGAMRPATAISADGPMNLANAVRVAADPASCGMGALVVMNDEIFSARDVSKTNTARLHTFRSLDFGPLGTVDGGKVHYYHRPLRRHTVDSEFHGICLADLPRVDILYSYIGADGILAKAILKAGARGIVLAGSGAGNIHPSARKVLQEARNKGLIVVRSSRTGSGKITCSPDAALQDITADNLNPQKARLLLMLALSKTRDPEELRRIFGEY
jgi:L-asparaginase